MLQHSIFLYTIAFFYDKKSSAKAGNKEVKIVYRLFLVNCYLLHVQGFFTSQPASSALVGGCVID